MILVELIEHFFGQRHALPRVLATASEQHCGAECDDEDERRQRDHDDGDDPFTDDALDDFRLLFHKLDLSLNDKVGGDRVDGEVGEGHLLVFVVERQVKVIADFCRVQVDSAVEHQVVIDQDASPAVESMIRYLI